MGLWEHWTKKSNGRGLSSEIEGLEMKGRYNKGGATSIKEKKGEKKRKMSGGSRLLNLYRKQKAMRCQHARLGLKKKTGAESLPLSVARLHSPITALSATGSVGGLLY